MLNPYQSPLPPLFREESSRYEIALDALEEQIRNLRGLIQELEEENRRLGGPLPVARVVRRYSN